MTTDPIIPLWITCSLAIGLLLAISMHTAILIRSTEPASRTRIRLANSAIMALATPLFVIGFSVIDHSTRPREWAMVWMLAGGLLALSVLLAMADAVNTMRLAVNTQRELRVHLRRTLHESVRQRTGGANADATEPEPGNGAG